MRVKSSGFRVDLDGYGRVLTLRVRSGACSPSLSLSLSLSHTHTHSLTLSLAHPLSLDDYLDRYGSVLPYVG